MKTGTKAKTDGRFHKLKRNVREIDIKQSDNPKQDAEGAGEKVAGVVQEEYGPFKRFMEN